MLRAIFHCEKILAERQRYRHRHRSQYNDEIKQIGRFIKLTTD